MPTKYQRFQVKMSINCTYEGQSKITEPYPITFELM